MGLWESAEGERTVVEMVSGDFSGGMYTISGLSAATVDVAAETSAGPGPYSEPVNIETSDSEDYICLHLLHQTALCHSLRFRPCIQFIT